MLHYYNATIEEIDNGWLVTVKSKIIITTTERYAFISWEEVVKFLEKYFNILEEKKQ